jgi:signal transduction histidine kinase
VPYRIIQEALTNAVKHAGASRVTVAARDHDGKLRSSVSDDGRGFEPETPVAGFGWPGCASGCCCSTARST